MMYLFILCFSVFTYYIFNGPFRTRVPYGEKKEKFTYQQSLVFIQCVVNSIFAYTGKFTIHIYQQEWSGC